MAYFYQHIKGLTNAGTLWKIDATTIDDSTANAMLAPELKYTKTGMNEVNCGRLITSNMINGVMSNAFTFNGTLTAFGDFECFHTAAYIKTLKIATSRVTTSIAGTIEYDINDSGMNFFANVDKDLVLKAQNSQSGDNKLTIGASQVKFEGVSQVGFRTRKTGSSTNLYDNPVSFAICDGFGTSSTYKGFYLHTPGNVLNNTEAVFNVPINATYFNATSDKRAKTGINKSTFSALKIINSLPIYNFKYKSDNSNSIGIIAQEALDINAGDFNLVVNPQASGENGNYMSVKESKLVYIAWKAIQEQQEIIDKQSKEIEELKQLVKALIEK